MSEFKADPFAQLHMRMVTSKAGLEELKSLCEFRTKKRFSLQEMKQLELNIQKYFLANNFTFPDDIALFIDPHRKRSTDFYHTIAWGIRRPLYNIYRHLCRRYRYLISKCGQWSIEEENRFVVLCRKYGKNWNKIANKLGRNRIDCIDKYNYSLVMGYWSTGTWSCDEKDKLTEAISFQLKEKGVRDTLEDPISPPPNTTIDASISSQINWNRISSHVSTRGPHQCFQKWNYSLSRFIHHPRRSWKVSDDLILIESILSQSVEDEYDIDFMKILKDHSWPKGKTISWLKRKWSRLVRTVPSYRVRTCAEVCSYLKNNSIPIMKKNLNSTQL